MHDTDRRSGVCYVTGVPCSTAPWILLAAMALAAVPGRADDVLIFDRGGGPDRVRLLADAIAAAGHTVVGVDDTAALDVAYAAGCTDAPCLARAGVAGGVDLVAMAEPAHVAVVDVVSSTLRRRSAPSDRIGVVTLKLFEPSRWGTLELPALPGDAVVTVDGAPWHDEDLAPGRHVLVVRSAEGTREVDVDVVGGASVPVVLPAPSAGPAGPHVGIVVGITGVGVGLAGLATGLVGEALFASVPLDPVPDADAARTLVVGEQMATIGWGIFVGGAVATIVGVGMAFLE